MSMPDLSGGPFWGRVQKNIIAREKRKFRLNR